MADTNLKMFPFASYRKRTVRKISYKVTPEEVMTHAGIPVFGLYPDYVNTIEVTYTRIDAKGREKRTSKSPTKFMLHPLR